MLRQLRQLISVVATGALAVSAPGAIGAAAAQTGVCQGVRHCEVVAFKDVDGDGARDQVGYVVRSESRVVLRVGTARGRVLTKTLDTPSWPGGAWLGAARIDGRRGVELVVGTDRGAHAELFTVVTYRRGDLVRESVPGPSHLWVVDAGISSYAGIWRRVRDGHAVVTLKSAERAAPLGRMFEGVNRRFVWRKGAWEHEATVRTTYPGPRTAGEIAGWHVRGLPRWPAGRP